MTAVQIVGGLGTVALMVGGGFLTNKYLLVETYRTKAKEEADIKDKKVYIGNDVSQIKAKLGEEAYKTALKTNWNKMDKEGITDPSEKPSDSDIENTSDTNKQDNVAKWTSAWCVLKSKVTYDSEDSTNKSDYETFKAVCFVSKPTPTGDTSGS